VRASRFRATCAYPQVPSALIGTHSYFGQQVAGSVATCFAPHLHAGVLQAALLAPVVEVVVRSQTGHLYVSQQVFGSMPFGIGVTPLGQTGANVGQATGLFGSHVGGFGAHLPSQTWPLQFPAASHTQLGSAVVQPQMASGGMGAAVGSFVTGVPPLLHPQPLQTTSHC